MASGQQKAQQNLDAFEVWQATQTDDDFKQITFKGQLNRIEVAKGVGCGKSALNQNPALRKALKSLEDSLRERGLYHRCQKVPKKRLIYRSNMITQRIAGFLILNVYLY
ncbi:VPA1267 family protein [Alishewanella longhuensis]